MRKNFNQAINSIGNGMVLKTFEPGVDLISDEITRVKGKRKITTADFKTESPDCTKGLQVYDKRALFATKTQQFSVLESRCITLRF